MKAQYEYFSSLNPYKMEIMQKEEEEGGRRSSGIKLHIYTKSY
jgi:hypothetical protein